MLGLAHTLAERGTARPRLSSTAIASGGQSFEAYLLGGADGQPKDAAWAAGDLRHSGRRDRRAGAARPPAGGRWSPARCRCSAPSMASSRSGWPSCWRRCSGRSACRAAASPTRSGRSRIPASRRWRCRCRPCRQGRNSVSDFIPVARIADMLLHPGEPFDYDGQRLTYPDIRLVYWAGGNPFHHHQDLDRLRRAFAGPTR